MLCFVNAHNLQSTAREVVARYARQSAPVVETETVPVPVVVSVPVPEVITAKPVAPQTISSARATVDRKRFVADLRQSSRHASRSPRRVCELRIHSGTLTLTTADNDGIVNLTVDAISAIGDCRIHIDDKRAAALAGKLKSSTIELELSQTVTDDDCVCRLQIVADGAEFELSAEPIDVPDINGPCLYLERLQYWDSEFPATYAQQINAGELLNALRRVEFATCEETTRYALGGVCYVPNGSGCTFAATDSRRLAVQELSAEIIGEFSIPEPDENGVRQPAIIPSGAVSQLIESLNRVPDDAIVMIASVNNSVFAQTVIESDGRFAIRTKNQNGRFPRYYEVIPRSCKIELKFDRRRMISAIESAAVVSNEQNRGMDFVLSTAVDNAAPRKAGTIELRAESDEFGKSKVTLATLAQSGTVADVTSESEFIVTMDPVYLIDFLKSSKADSVNMRLINSDTAVVMTDGSYGESCFVIMPLFRD